MTEIHGAAERGFSAEAQAYARGRPDYPAELTGWLGDVLVLPGRTVIDLGAGTGKFTKLLVASGADVIAVEPVDAMRAQFATGLAQVQVMAGNAEAMPLADASADAVVCAQAFHWFATERALAQIHRVLRPGGRLGLVWNVRDESVDWVAAITEIITPHEGDAPRFHSGEWRKAFDGRYFDAPQLTSFVHQHSGTAQEVIVDRFLSVSFIAALPPDEKEKVAEQLRTLAATHPALRGRETISLPYRTEAYACTRLD